jgi:hypothetical protein
MLLFDAWLLTFELEFVVIQVKKNLILSMFGCDALVGVSTLPALAQEDVLTDEEVSEAIQHYESLSEEEKESLKNGENIQWISGAASFVRGVNGRIGNARQGSTTFNNLSKAGYFQGSISAYAGCPAGVPCARPKDIHDQAFDLLRIP